MSSYDDEEQVFIPQVHKSVNSLPGPDPAASLAKERDGAFNTLSMHQFLEGKEKSKEVIRLFRSLERDPILGSTPNDYDISKDEQRELTVHRINRMARFIEQESPESFSRRLNLLTIYDGLTGIRISVNLVLFGNGIKGNGTAEQYRYWCVDGEAKNLKNRYGCFAMTELGHGSNVAGVETTATFDKETDEFVIETPHIGATKWWIGGAAHSATHTVCYARLIVEGKDYGVKTFVVPLRDSNHDLMPGIAVGDIGAKMGRQGIDNGWIQFTDVRIPRFFMLQKFCKVSREGKVTLPPLEQLSYISLLGGRVSMATDSYRIIARFSTIAIRYGVGRRQFQREGAEDEDPEVQIMDYKLHQRRLIPILALGYAISQGSNRLELDHNRIVKELDDVVARNDQRGIAKALNETKSLFNDSGSLKSTATWLAGECISECRQACGGVGYSSYNGFGNAYNDWAVQCTWEGDNTVLGMSVGKTILKSVQQVVKGKKVDADSTIAFLNKVDEYKNLTNVLLVSDLHNPSAILKALEVLIIKLSLGGLETLKATRGDWDQLSALRVNLSKLRCHHYLLELFIESFATADASLKPFLDRIINLYANVWILELFAGDFLIHKVFDSSVKSVQTTKTIPELCTALRPQLILLTDSFQQPDAILNSAIGKYDGNIYENYFDITKKQNPPIKTKAPYTDVLQGFLGRDSIDARERGEKSEESKEILTRR